MRILVYDLDKSACQLLVRTLQSHFPEHEWLTAFSYEEGLALAQNADRLDLVFADLKTNEAAGPSLAHLIEGMFPSVQVYYLGIQTQETTFFRARAGRMFAKPVNINEVVAAIHFVEARLAGDASTEEATGSIEKINRLITHEGFSGQIKQFHLHEIIQLCCLGQRTGRMSVSKGEESGAIYFYDGRILHAECGPVQGEDAVRSIVSWRAGQFAFVEGIIADRETIQSSWDFLLLETMQKLDEAAAEGLSAKAELREGQCFGPYQLIRQIAASPNEQIYEAQLSHTGLLVRLCVLPSALTSNSAAVRQFVAEATARSESDSPIFLRATKAAQTEGVYYYTLEHVTARALVEFGADRPLTEPQALEVLKSVARAMVELHAQHQLHHPLAPRDVLIDSRGQVRISNLASLRPDLSLSMSTQIEALGSAVQSALGPHGVRSAAIKTLLRRMQPNRPDQIVSWAGLRKAAEGISSQAVLHSASATDGSDDHTSFVVNLVPDHSSLGILKLGLAAGFAGLLLGSVFWGSGRPDHVRAREPLQPGSLMAAEIPEGVVRVATNAPVSQPAPIGSDRPQIYRSLQDLSRATAAQPVGFGDTDER